ncbi:YoaK family protein [Rathayibacter oskolensis]|uniref:YoaK family protein n=1 Tax=Rathayibacter oskolensis TaxID=1891671 RepID=UPI00265FFAA1|nr:YoaK family protein [Rathayibacter oskolensis]WKK71536.1 YoaK family protein [Rathayibacter oskolensis]
MFKRLRTRPDNVHLGLMLALTFSTGIIDAVGYLGLDRVFTGNMTGNVVILGMALAGADDLPVVGPIIALAGFMLGAAIGGRVLRPVKAGWTTRSTWLFTVVGIVMAVLAIVLGVVPEHPEPLALTVTGVLGLAMGLQAATARHIAVKDVTTVVVTSTITGLAADSRLGGGKGQPWFRRLTAVVLIGAGAGVGALALNAGLWLGLALAAAITLIASSSATSWRTPSTPPSPRGDRLTLPQEGVSAAAAGSAGRGATSGS